MNLFRFLKSTKGAIKPLNALLISGAAGAVFTYTVGTTAHNQIEAERAVRPLTSIQTGAPQQNLRRQGDLLTSINVRDGAGQLASAEERAARNGGGVLDRYEANQRALDNLESNLGRAMQLSPTEGGLNTGNRNAVQSSARFTVEDPEVNGGNLPLTRSDGPQGGGAAPGARPKLPSASITRAAGNSFGGTSGGVSGANSGPGNEAPARGADRPRLSGAMPSGTNIVSRREGAGLGTRNPTASFGDNRHTRISRSRHSRNETDELKDIVKRSADAARNTHNASGNEGGRAFLASAIDSGGVNVTGTGEDSTASSADLAAATNKRLKAIGNKLNNIPDEQEERNQEQKALIVQFISTVAGSIALMVAGALILKHYDDMIREWLATTGGAPWAMARWVQLVTTRWIIAGIMMATVAGFNAWLMTNAIKFMNKYQSGGGTNIAKMAIILAPIMVAGMTYTAIKPEAWKGLGKNIWGKVKAAFEPVGLLTGQVTNSITGMFK